MISSTSETQFGVPWWKLRIGLRFTVEKSLWSRFLQTDDGDVEALSIRVLLTPQGGAQVADPGRVVAASGFVRDVSGRGVEIQIPDIARTQRGRQRRICLGQDIGHRKGGGVDLIPRSMPFQASLPGDHGASPQVRTGTGGVLLPQVVGEVCVTTWAASVLGRSQ